MQAVRGIVAALLSATAVQEPGVAPPASAQQAGQREVERAFLEHGIHLDLARGTCWIPAGIDVREDLLEYLLVNPKGAAHESLLTTEIVPSRLNAALLALGAAPGRNAAWKTKDPPPSEEEIRDGASPYVVEPPNGDGFCLYVGWREGGETHFHRVDDLLRNLESGRSMRRHAWVFLGSRVVRMRPKSEPKDAPPKEVFAADIEGNLVNISFFEEGNTLVTAALPECLKQTIWLANGWLLPQRGSPVALVFSRRPLEAPPDGMAKGFPEVVEVPDGNGGR